MKTQVDDGRTPKYQYDFFFFFLLEINLSEIAKVLIN